jgi:pimeloyl-ACP methyl ester carboxylesterase
VCAAPPTPVGLVPGVSPVPGLALFERRVTHPTAVLVCVHGGLDRGGSFARLARRLDGLNVIAYDRRGYQGSRALGPSPLAGHVDDLVAIARHEAPVAPVVAFGHSFGGLVALAGAAREPDLFSSVILFETPLPWIVARHSGRPEPSDDPDLEAELFFRRVMSDAAWERLSETERQSRRLDGPALLADLAVTRGPCPVDLAAMTTPVTLIHGDGYLGEYYRSLTRELAAVSPSIVTLEMAHTGHGAHLSRPGQLAEVITRLIKERCALA